MDEKLKILLCEDDENLGMLLREYLQAKGYMAELCPDGEAGYKAFMKTKFDICVLDVMMPKKTVSPLRRRFARQTLRFQSSSLQPKHLKKTSWKVSKSVLTTISQNLSLWRNSYSELRQYCAACVERKQGKYDLPYRTVYFRHTKTVADNRRKADKADNKGE